MRRLRAECESVRVPDYLGNREGNDVTDHALLRRGTRRHAREVDGVLACPEVLRHVLGLRGAGRHLELHVRMFLRGGDHRTLEPERRREDDLVAVTDETLDDLRHLRSFRNVFLERRLDIRAELALDVETSLVVGLRPPAVVVRADVDPGGLECRRLLLRPGRAVRDAERENQRGGEHERQAEGEPAFLHVLLSPVPKDRAWRL